MAVTWSLRVDRLEDGTPKIPRGGGYRFSLRLHDVDTQAVLTEVNGFRVDIEMTRVIAPSAINGGRVYTIVSMSPKWQTMMLDYLRKLRPKDAQDGG